MLHIPIKCTAQPRGETLRTLEQNLLAACAATARSQLQCSTQIEVGGSVKISGAACLLTVALKFRPGLTNQERRAAGARRDLHSITMPEAVGNPAGRAVVDPSDRTARNWPRLYSKRWRLQSLEAQQQV